VAGFAAKSKPGKQAKTARKQRTRGNLMGIRFGKKPCVLDHKKPRKVSFGRKVIDSKGDYNFPLDQPPSCISSYPSELFTQREAKGKLSLGDGMPSGSVGMSQRRGNRMKAVLPVRIKGKDSAGKAFDELAHTLDVTATGARLGSVRRELNTLDEITVFYRQRKLQFRVVWIKKMKGTTEFQVGLQAVTQDKEAWGMSQEQQNAPEPPMAASASGIA